MRQVFTIIIFLSSAVVFSQKEAYKIFDSKGRKVSYEKMYKELSKKDIVFFGELHDNPIAHWLELEITQDLNADSNLILGAEMLEADIQEHVNAYLKGDLEYDSLDSLGRFWKNFKSDYGPILDYAKENDIPVIATNIPRKFAKLVNKEGFEALDSLSAEEKSWIAPLPIQFDPELPVYQEMLEMMGDHGSPKIIMAQAIKDATMAHFILENYKEDHILLHINGSYHSDNYTSILWYLDQEETDLKIGTISTVSQKNVHSLMEKNKGKADFIICVDADMTKTY